MDPAMSGHGLRRLLNGIVVFGALATGSIWVSNGLPASATAGPLPARQAINFDDPGTLAWSIQAPGGPRERLHNVICVRTAEQSFTCRGEALTGKHVVVLATVSRNGLSWSSH